jgi:DNA-binding MarR family transcriptional regulator
MSSDERVDPPAIGGLLRMAWQAHRDRMFECLNGAGYPEVTRAQFALFRWPGVDGMRPGEVADLAGLSKQAVNDTLGELERAGYIERHPDPGDGRARIVRLTDRGRELQRAAHETSRTLERAWSESLGEERFAVLRETLQEMIAAGGTLEAPEAPAPPVTARR